MNQVTSYQVVPAPGPPVWLLVLLAVTAAVFAVTVAAAVLRGRGRR